MEYPMTPPAAESPKPPDLTSTGTNTGASSPKVERDSPEPNCAICLGKTENKSFTDSCLHQFCFSCLLEWSKVKAECPLCKQSFKSIIHNVRSNEDYDQYHLHLHPPPEPNFWPNVEANVVRVRYRTTLTGERQRERFLETIMTPYLMNTDAIPAQRNFRRRHRMFTSDFRALVYRDNLWVNPLPDLTGRYRECSPEFYRMNPAQVHRLAPWLNRELSVLRIPSTHIMVVMEMILNLLTRYPINSVEFRSHVSPHLGANTDHFIHEFYAFARSPYDMMGFDQSAEYRERAPTYTFEVQPNDSDSDSDVIVISPPSSPHTAVSRRQPPASQPPLMEIAASASSSQAQGRLSPVPGPSGLGGLASSFMYTVSGILGPPPVPEQPQPSTSTSAVDNQETVMESDPDDCVIVGYVKPRHERTPEIITLESDHEENHEDRGSAESYVSDLLLSSTSSDSKSDSDFIPYGHSSKKRISKYKKGKKNTSSSTSSDEPIFFPKRRERLRILSADSDSSAVSHCCHKKKSSKSKGKKRLVPVSPDSSDGEPSNKAAARKRKNDKEVWRIVKKKEPENDHDYSLDSHDPPYNENEYINFKRSSRPKLRSIVITKSAGSGSQRERSYSSVASSSHSSSFHHDTSKRRAHRSHKRDELKKKDRQRYESPSPVRNSKVKRKSKKTYLSSDSSS